MPTLPPFGDFSAQATAPGVLISWRCRTKSVGKSEIKYLFRIYRRPESSSSETKIADVMATECALGAAAAAEITTFLDQTVEWEKTYFYRGTVVSLMETAGRAAVEVEGCLLYTSNHGQRDIAIGEVNQTPAEMIGQVGAARTTLLPSRTKHKVIHDQLASAAKQVSQRHFAVRAIEYILLFSLLPRQFAPLLAQLIS